MDCPTSTSSSDKQMKIWAKAWLCVFIKCQNNAFLQSAVEKVLKVFALHLYISNFRSRHEQWQRNAECLKQCCGSHIQLNDPFLWLFLNAGPLSLVLFITSQKRTTKENHKVLFGEPYIFLLYWLPLQHIMSTFKDISYHCYADYIRLYISFMMFLSYIA